MERLKEDIIVNFSAESHVDRSLDGPSLFVKTNVLGTSVDFESARRCGVRKVVQVSTDEVYEEIFFGFGQRGGSPISQGPLCGQQCRRRRDGNGLTTPPSV